MSHRTTAFNSGTSPLPEYVAYIEPPRHMDGPAFPVSVKKGQYIFAARDRVDEAVDCGRYVRFRRYKHIRPCESDYVYSGTCSLASTANLTALTLR
jgi:hypothetical protein